MGALFVHFAQAEGNMDQRVGIRAAGFQHQYPVAGVCAQTIGKHAPRAARAHNHIIVFFRPGHSVRCSFIGGLVCGISLPPH